MAREVQILVGDDEIDITIETGTRKPTGIVRIAGICLDGYLVSLAPFQEFTEVDIKTEVTIIGTSDTLTIEINISYQHDTLEVEHDALSLPFIFRSQLIAIPANAHLLESTRTQSAAHVASGITVIWSLAGIRSHPVLTDQEVVGKIHHLITALSSFQLRDILHITAMELPSLVDADCIANRRFCRKGTHQRQTCHQQRGEKYSLLIHFKFILLISVRLGYILIHGWIPHELIEIIWLGRIVVLPVTA